MVLLGVQRLQDLLDADAGGLGELRRSRRPAQALGQRLVQRPAAVADGSTVPAFPCSPAPTTRPGVTGARGPPR
ncbi:MAG: hypothetical protein ABT15_11930 [Pseudonocardia sp. SCN 73-27]|nr:MAG: hypothetical protein ABS80_05445 [Pseudonocardia sp. SCN 72-51]ODV06536.1 MAG: hypothetical protein ABT15_11930 [Pseudonocardia sp. SCN 73-27]